MRKISLILALSFLLTANVLADITEIFCLPKIADLKKAKERFEQWRISVLEEVARLKLKSKIK